MGHLYWTLLWRYFLGLETFSWCTLRGTLYWWPSLWDGNGRTIELAKLHGPLLQLYLCECQPHYQPKLKLKFPFRFHEADLPWSVVSCSLIKITWGEGWGTHAQQTSWEHLLWLHKTPHSFWDEEEWITGSRRFITNHPATLLAFLSYQQLFSLISRAPFQNNLHYLRGSQAVSQLLNGAFQLSRDYRAPYIELPDFF